MWSDLTGHILTVLALWSAGLVAVHAGTRVLRIRSARARQLALWVAYVSLAPAALVSFWFRPTLSLLPARPVATGTAAAATPVGSSVDVAALALLAAVMVGAGFALRAWLDLCAARKTLTPCTDTRVERLLAQLKHDLGIRQGVQCLTCAGDGSPFSAGWIRPSVVLPRAVLREADDATLEHILFHELVHIRHADFALNAVQKLTRSLVWFNPVAHLYDGLLEQWREMACDAEVLARGTVSRSDYARTLLALSTTGRSGVPIASVALIRRHSNLKQRMRHMRITQTGDRLVKRVLLGTLAAIPFALVACSNSDVNGPSDREDAAAKDAQTLVLREPDTPARVQFGDIHLREDGTRELHFVKEDGPRTVVEFVPDHTISKQEMYELQSRLEEEGNLPFGDATWAHEADEGHNVFVEKIEDAAADE